MYTSMSNNETSILNLTHYIVIKTNGAHIRYRLTTIIYSYGNIFKLIININMPTKRLRYNHVYIKI